MIVTYYEDEKVKSFDLSKKGLERVIIDKDSDVEIIYQDEEWFLVYGFERIILKEESSYEFSIDGKNYLVITEESSMEHKIFMNYSVLTGERISVGSSEQNDIVVHNARISNQHLTIQFKIDGSIEIIDLGNLGSSNGTYINGQKIYVHQAKFGDVIYLYGVKIIIGNKFISINNLNNKVKIQGNKLRVLQNELIPKDKYYNEFCRFYPSPRFKREIEMKTFKVDAPPDNQIGETMPMVFMIGPSITMGMASFTTAMFSVNNAIVNKNIGAALPSIVMSFGMILGTVMWPVLTKRYDKKKREKKETLRQEKYSIYLKEIENKVNGEKKLQKAIINENFADIENCVKRIENVSRNLWERAPGQKDFLQLRVGIGDVPLVIELLCPERKFSLTDDNLQNAMFEYCEHKKMVTNVPITISLFENFITGIVCKQSIRRDIIKNLIFQLAAYYSYDDVKMVFITNEEEYDYLRWLPHNWNNEKTVRFFVKNLTDSKDVIAYLNAIYEQRSELSENDVREELPYYIIFDMNREITRKIELVNKICKSKNNLNFSVISICTELKDIPKESSNVVEVTLESGRIFDKNDSRGISLKFDVDKALHRDMDKLSKKLANIMMDNYSDIMMPNNLSFLQMYQVGKIEHLNVLNRWKENNPVTSLEVPIGVDSFGELFRLDLHEKYDGPHGLVAGMTGSGKSEFIMTYILSLAVNYHPDEVAFILIDYKGGGMAKTFEKLPHVVGIITNLDGSSVKRSLVSIQSELRRRQTIFANISKDMKISNVDIYKYQHLYRERKVYEPLQHLFIISDEFAELKTQQPQFMEQLISAARIGRSLGVHLILATQKPAGVVDDQIWSNSRFRACLKVQERADSMDMLKRPDAAELSTVGRFYLQVGYNEKFDMGQSAYAGAPYYPMDKVMDNAEDYIEVVNSVGRPLKIVKHDKFKKLYSKVDKQIDSITSYLHNLAENENIYSKPMWLPELQKNLYVDELKKKYKEKGKMNTVLCPIIGEYDDPANQKQALLRLPISKDGNVIIYGVAGSGKTTLLTTVLYGLIAEHTPEELSMYVLDFDSEKLKCFSRAPHVGDVIYSYEREKVKNLFKLLIEEINRRKKVLSEYEGDYGSYILNHNDMEYMVVVINNYTIFFELYDSELEMFEYLTREGTKYGLHFIITCNKVNGVSSRINQNFKQQMVLQFHSEDDYMMVVGKTDGLYPAKIKGRGLIKIDKVYEFQTAELSSEESSISYLNAYCNAYIENWTGRTAKHVPVLPEVVDFEFISGYQNKKISANRYEVPVGVNTESHEVITYDFAMNYVNLIISSEDGYRNFARCMCRLLCSYLDSKCVIIDMNNCVEIHDGAEFIKNNSDIRQKISELFELVRDRNNNYVDTEDKTKLEEFESILVVFSGFSKFSSILNGEESEKLQLILEKGKIEYGVNIIILDCVQNLKSMLYDKWFKNNFNKNYGIYIGSDISNQYLLNVSDKNSSQMNRISEPFGFVIHNGKVTKVKTLWEDIKNE